ncbi:MAG: hypothetical protein ACR2KT_15330, partial [Methylocella sp.]
APPQIKETQLPHRTAPIGQIQRDSLNLICWPRGRGIFRDAQLVTQAQQISLVSKFTHLERYRFFME